MPVFSHSSLGTFESCPLHYKFKYVLRLPPPEERESIELFLGKRVHESLAGLYTSPESLSIADVLARFEENWKTEWHDGIFIAKEGVSSGEYLRKGETYLSTYYCRHAPFNEDRTLAVEKRIHIPLGRYEEYAVTGVLDRLSVDDEGAYTIHDYKTSSKMPSQSQIEQDRQLVLYQIGVQKTLVEDASFSLAWHYLAFDHTIRLKKTSDQVRDIERSTIKLAIRVQSATEEDEFPARVGPLCTYCEYKPVCPAWTGQKQSKQMTLA